MNDPRLDRRVEFDPRSRDYPIRGLLATATPRSYTWRVGAHLDQGSEGACVGFAATHEAAARPAVVAVSQEIARAVYKRAQQLDQWPGESYEGTSVLAGMKAGQERGWWREYRWAFGIDDLAAAVGRAGPAVLGLDWHAGMMRPDADGFIHPTGSVQGGHAILCYSVNVRRRVFRLWNSWGPGWGQGGSCLIGWDDLAQLLAADGEAAIPVGRKR